MSTERLKRSGVMLCYPFEEKRLLSWEPPYVVQPKLDGERCRAVFSGDDDCGYKLISSTGAEITSVPHINQALNNLYRSQGITDELDGEIYCHGMPFEQIHSRVSRTVNYHPEFDQIEFHVFDLVSDDTQYMRTLRLHHMLQLKWPLEKVKFSICFNLEDVWDCYVQYLNKGYEGIIARHLNAPYVRKRSTTIMKFKPKKSDWYTVVGTREELDKNGQPKGTLGALVCCSDDGTEFTVGSGLTKQQRVDLWAERGELIGCVAHVQYQHITPGRGVPRFPVFVKLHKGVF